MPYRGYVSLDAPDPTFREINSLLERRNIASLRRALADDESYNVLMMTATGAILNARPRQGPFPLVVYSSGLNESWQHANVVLGEYLASHGYIVVTVPQLGRTCVSLNLALNPADLETQVRDLEYAIGVMHRYRNVDRTKLCVMGHSMGGVAALIVQMRNTDVDAIIGLDGSYGVQGLSETLTKSIFYSPENVRVPLLDLRRPSEKPDSSALESFRYSDRYLVEFPGIQHSDFTSFPMIALRFPTKIEGRSAETASRGYEWICRYVLNFLDGYVKGQEQGLRFITNQPEANDIPDGVLRVRIREAERAGSRCGHGQSSRMERWAGMGSVGVSTTIPARK